jgi:hypothetical protein
MIANLHSNIIEPLNRFGDNLDTLRSSFLLLFYLPAACFYLLHRLREHTQTNSRDAPPNRL